MLVPHVPSIEEEGGGSLKEGSICLQPSANLIPMGPMNAYRPCGIFTAATLLFVASAPLSAQSVTPLEEHFGHEIGADYQLSNYTQHMAYWHTLERESDRVVLDEIGRTAEDRPQMMAIVTSPANQARLEEYRQISRRLALVEGLDEAAARELAAEGKAVIWIAWFDSEAPLRSGWAWGQHRLNGDLAMAEAKVGEGNLFLFGPEITMRGQPHGTFPFLFNGIYLAGAQPLPGRPIS